MVSASSADMVVTGSEEVASEFFPLDSLQIDALAMGAGDALGAQIYGREIELRVEAGREYLLAVESASPVAAKLDDSTGDIRVVDVMHIKPGLMGIAFRAERSGTIKGAVGAEQPTGSVGYELRAAKVEPITPETVARAAMARWLRDLSRRDGSTLKSSLVKEWKGHTESGSSGTDVASRDLPIEGSGRWFLVAVSVDHGRMDLKVLDDKGAVIKEDAQPDWYPFVAFDTRAGKAMKAEVVSGTKDAEFRLFLYKADER